MLRKSKQYNIYTVLYNRIPENHILKKINDAVDLSFVNRILRRSYNEYYGSPAVDPEILLRLNILKYLYDKSDELIIEEADMNIAYRWFIGVNPDEDLPDKSLLSKFRTLRLKETTIDDIIQELVRQCVEKGIIKGNGISIDSTHAEANTKRLIPERIMKRLARKIFKSIEKEKGAIPDNINTEIPEYKNIEDPAEAKEVMKEYLEELIEKTEAVIDPSEDSVTHETLVKAKEILADPKFIEQKGVRSLVDEDARVGHKTQTETFFGYKVEYAMIPEERIITAVTVGSGAYVDGTEFEKLYEMTKKCGIDIKDAYGDKAYFRKPILDILKKDNVNAYIPVSESAYKIDDSKYSYNKDSDQWFCEEGNCTVAKRRSKKKNRDSFVYRFDNEICRNCSKRQECIKGKQLAKSIEISVNTPELYEYSQRAKTEEFKEKYKKRASHEWKNGELKRFHGMDRAKGYGLKSMLTQAKLTALAANLKRIANLVSSFNPLFCLDFTIFGIKLIVI